MRRVFVYGGCASRDSVEWYPEYHFDLHSYIARQSLISAFHPANPKLWDFSPMTQRFQQRMMRGDIVGNLRTHLHEHCEDIDLIIWDLMIERVGVREIRSGGFMTNNPSNRKYVKKKTSIGARITFGTDEHLELWSDALKQFVTLLKGIGLYSRVVVNGSPWALADKHGQQAYYPNTGIDPGWFNSTIEKYWQVIECHGIPIARVDQGDAIADPPICQTGSESL